MKQFKARVENPVPGWHAIEIYLEADNIIQAGNDILGRLGNLGIDPADVSRLVELDSPKVKDPPKCVFGYVNCTYHEPKKHDTYHRNHHLRNQ